MNINSPIWMDAYLQDSINCPSTIIWNGDLQPKNNALDQQVLDQRTVIVGGGNTPFLRLPEQFAWTLSRFVEQQVSPPTNNNNNNNNNKLIKYEQHMDTSSSTSISMSTDEEQIMELENNDNNANNNDNYYSIGDQNNSLLSPQRDDDNNNNNNNNNNNMSSTRLFKLQESLKDIFPGGNRNRNMNINIGSSISNGIIDPLQQFFSSGSLLVSGRVIATAIIYVSFAKVALFQYQGMRNIHSSYLRLTVWRKQINRLWNKNGLKQVLLFLLPQQRHPNVANTDTDTAIISQQQQTHQDLQKLPTNTQHDDNDVDDDNLTQIEIDDSIIIDENDSDNQQLEQDEISTEQPKKETEKHDYNAVPDEIDNHRSFSPFTFHDQIIC